MRGAREKENLIACVNERSAGKQEGSQVEESKGSGQTENNSGGRETLRHLWRVEFSHEKTVAKNDATPCLTETVVSFISVHL